MAGSPKKRTRREAEQAGNDARESFSERHKTALAEAREARAQAEREKREASGLTREQIRQQALEKFWPIAEAVVEKALRGEEVNREQLSAAFKVLEQQLGRPGQQSDETTKDQPTVIVYESAALTPLLQ